MGHYYTFYGYSKVIDSDGYRANVGIILSKPDGKLFWCRRIGQQAWQFPQGGIREHETPEQALFRELREETGLLQVHVSLLGSTRDWLKYKLPEQYVRWNTEPLCLGQKQKWFLLRFEGEDDLICLQNTEKPEFEQWEWVDYWHPLEHIVEFKRDVYRRALTELEPILKASRG